jgi:hypothetical protein
VMILVMTRVINYCAVGSRCRRMKRWRMIGRMGRRRQRWWVVERWRMIGRMSRRETKMAGGDS